MALITITVTPSTDQLIEGIPKTVTITTDIASIIFYTLDGSEPSVDSEVYTAAIPIPTNQSSVTLKVFATNGTDNSDIYSTIYSADLTGARTFFAKAEILNPLIKPGCGSVGDPPRVLYSQPADNPQDAAGVIPVDFDGYGSDPSVYPVRQYDEPIPTYSFEYSETNWKGEMGKDIGTLPAHATIVVTPPAPEQSNLNSALYDPRALVTFHDGTKPNANEDTLFRPYFEGEYLQKSMYGTGLSTTAASDGNFGPTGSLLKYHYNPTENTITFYYYDNRCCRWVISKEKIKAALPVPSQANPLYNFISPSLGDRHVYRWMLFKQPGII